MKEYKNYSLLTQNTFGIDVFAKKYVEFDTESEVQEYTSSLNLGQENVLPIGQGSNLLFTKDYQGVVFHSKIHGIDIVLEDEDSVTLRVGSGVIWDDFVNYCVLHSYYGLENLSLIPGEVGASAVQNIGAYGVEVKDWIERVETIEIQTGQKRVFQNADCRYSYRSSIFKNEKKGEYFVAYVVFRLKKDFVPQLKYGTLKSLFNSENEPTTAQQMRTAIIQIRQDKLPDPKYVGNAGSFFMNPIIEAHDFFLLQKEYPKMPYYEVGENYKIPAAWLIEQAGWKGRKLGNAGVCEKQALILINCGNATGEDIVSLKEAICKDVKDKFGIELNPEVQFL